MLTKIEMEQIETTLQSCCNKRSTLVLDSSSKVKDLLDYLDIFNRDCYFTSNGRLVYLDTELQNGQTYQVVPRMRGGKGGFGSMLRALGAQIEKTTNREACRDLSGRRMRDVNNEKKLKEWVEKKAEREKEKERKRQERREKRLHFLTEAKHTFDDPEYHKQKMHVTEQLEDAVQQGLKNAIATAGTSRKRKVDVKEAGSSGAKKSCEWLGVDMSDLSDDSSDSEESVQDDLPQQQSLNDELSMDNQAEDEPAERETAEQASSEDDPAQQVSSMQESSLQDMPSQSSSPENSTHHQSSSSPVQTASSVEEPIPSAVEESQSAQAEGIKTDSKPANEQNSEQQSADDEQEMDLLTYSDVSELEAAGLERLKLELQRRGLKCGGTLEQRAQRLWAVRGKAADDIDPALFAKSTKGRIKGKKQL